MNLRHRAGFTIIELLVVTTIIVTLTGVVAVSFRSANASARDAKRRADLEELRGALENYRLEMGVYPVSGGGVGYETSVDGTFPDNLPTTYTSKRYLDPKNDATYNYRYRRPGLPGCQYELSAKMEGGSTGRTCAACGYTDDTYYCVTD